MPVQTLHCLFCCSAYLLVEVLSLGRTALVLLSNRSNRAIGHLLRQGQHLRQTAELFQRFDFESLRCELHADQEGKGTELMEREHANWWGNCDTFCAEKYACGHPSLGMFSVLVPYSGNKNARLLAGTSAASSGFTCYVW